MYKQHGKRQRAADDSFSVRSAGAGPWIGMALKSTIYKAELQIADMDRHYYADHALTIARHPSETDERMMVRVAAFALFALGFAGIAVCLASLYLAQKGWESGVARLAASQNTWVLAARRATAVSEEWVRRPLRRPDSEPAH